MSHVGGVGDNHSNIKLAAINLNSASFVVLPVDDFLDDIDNGTFPTVAVMKIRNDILSRRMKIQETGLSASRSRPFSVIRYFCHRLDGFFMVVNGSELSFSFFIHRKHRLLPVYFKYLKKR